MARRRRLPQTLGQHPFRRTLSADWAALPDCVPASEGLRASVRRRAWPAPPDFPQHRPSRLDSRARVDAPRVPENLPARQTDDVPTSRAAVTISTRCHGNDFTEM